MAKNDKFDQGLAKLVSQSNDPLLQPLRTNIVGDLASTTADSESVARTLLDKTNLEQDRKDIQYDTRIHHRSLLLAPASSTSDSRLIKAESRKRRLQAKKKPRPLTAREKRELGLKSIPTDAHKWSLYQPLHELWTGYISEIVTGGGMEAKLLKADYHGAQLKVIKSSCPSMLFLTGIVIKETRHTFIICTGDDKIKTIPKKCTVFEFEVNLVEKSTVDSPQCIRWEVYGEHFGFRAAERVGKKFKGKHTIDF